MDLSYLERRQDSRRQAYQPITLRLDDAPRAMPAHLVDLSQGGAGIMTTDLNAPMLGQRIDIEFDTFSDEPTESPRKRRETGVVVNIRPQQRGIARFGIRFIQRPESPFRNLFSPDPLIDGKPMPAFGRHAHRWETARGFKEIEQFDAAAAAAAN